MRGLAVSDEKHTLSGPGNRARPLWKPMETPLRPGTVEDTDPVRLAGQAPVSGKWAELCADERSAGFTRARSGGGRGGALDASLLHWLLEPELDVRLGLGVD